VSAAWAERKKHLNYDNLCAAATTTGGHGASTQAVYYLFNKHLRDSGVPGEALKRKLKKDISFALHRGTVRTFSPAFNTALSRQSYSTPVRVTYSLEQECYSSGYSQQR
jgi:hypothetical protein